MRHNPDDRRDNVEKIQKNIDNTIRNMEIAEEIISNTDDDQKETVLKEKNDRRAEALDNMKSEIKDEAIDRKHGYK